MDSFKKHTSRDERTLFCIRITNVGTNAFTDYLRDGTNERMHVKTLKHLHAAKLKVSCRGRTTALIF